MSKKKRPSHPILVPFEVTGVKDAVSLTVMSAVPDKTGSKTKNYPTRMLASYEANTVTFFVMSEQPYTFVVRLDELMALLKAASDSAKSSSIPGLA